MRSAIPYCLWVGNVMDVDSFSSVLDVGIEALVDLGLNEKPVQLTRELIYCRFPLNDGGGNSPNSTMNRHTPRSSRLPATRSSVKRTGSNANPIISKTMNAPVPRQVVVIGHQAYPRTPSRPTL